jgi:hypothetical protein
VRGARENQVMGYGWALVLMLFTMLATGCAAVNHKHPEYEVNVQAVQEATQKANVAAQRANTAAQRAEQAAARSEAAAVRAEQAAQKAEAIFKQGLRK